MPIATTYKDLGRIDYEKAWKYQERLFASALEAKKTGGTASNHLLSCEHPHVYTLGKSGDKQNLLLNHVQLVAKNASFYNTNRGGDITYHGPGQIVGYPIIDLSQFGMGVKDYVFHLEEAIINCIAEYGLKGERLKGSTGVWLDIGKPNTRKICAIGVKVSRWITMHGFAFNSNTDLKYFSYINPCGFIDKGVTSLEQETGKKTNTDDVKKNLIYQIANTFNMKLL